MDAHIVIGDVDLQPRKAQHLFRLLLGCAEPAQHRLDPGHYLPGAEGLDDIVVRPQLQPQDPVDLLPLGRQHDDGGAAGSPDLPTNIHAAFLRHL